MSISSAELSVALELALRAAHVASSIIDSAIEERDHTLIDINFKGNPCDLVTQFDQQCEEEVLSILRSGTPHYDVLSEETHSTMELSDRPTWIVDPIDGTTSFVHGLFDCCVSIALAVNRQPVLGVVAAPRLREVYSAVAGRGAYCNGLRLHVSERRALREAIVYVHQSYNREAAAVESIIKMQSELARVPVHAVRNHGSAALDMCFVASGRAELYLEAGIYPWDIAAGAVVLLEAGGVVQNLNGAGTFDLMARDICCANSPELAQAGAELAKKHNYRKAVMPNVA